MRAAWGRGVHLLDEAQLAGRRIAVIEGHRRPPQGIEMLAIGAHQQLPRLDTVDVEWGGEILHKAQRAVDLTAFDDQKAVRALPRDRLAGDRHIEVGAGGIENQRLGFGELRQAVLTREQDSADAQPAGLGVALEPDHAVRCSAERVDLSISRTQDKIAEAGHGLVLEPGEGRLHDPELSLHIAPQHTQAVPGRKSVEKLTRIVELQGFGAQEWNALERVHRVEQGLSTQTFRRANEQTSAEIQQIGVSRRESIFVRIRSPQDRSARPQVCQIYRSDRFITHLLMRETAQNGPRQGSGHQQTNRGFRTRSQDQPARATPRRRA